MALEGSSMALVVDIKWQKKKKKGEFFSFFNNTKGKIKKKLHGSCK